MEKAVHLLRIEDQTSFNAVYNFGEQLQVGSAEFKRIAWDKHGDVQEFSVLTSNYSAEYGKTSGGVVNAISHSGTNQFHGSAFEFLRNSHLDARNFFDESGKPTHPSSATNLEAPLADPSSRTILFSLSTMKGRASRRASRRLRLFRQKTRAMEYLPIAKSEGLALTSQAGMSRVRSPSPAPVAQLSASG